MDVLRVMEHPENSRPPHLRESEELFRLLVDGVKDYAIFVLDPNGIVSSWNTGAQNIKGYAATEIIGSHFSRFYTPEDLARNWPQRELEIAREQGRFEDEGWRVRKDGTRFWANVTISALYDASRNLIGFAKVTRDLTARRHLEAMEETGRQMNEFLAMLGHELRNPLSAIVNALALMRMSKGKATEQAQEVMDRQINHLVRIVDDLLDVGRITKGKIALNQETLDLKALVTQIVESAMPSIEARAHKVDLQFEADLLAVRADSTRLSQIILNLLSNAIKYTPDGGRIMISTTSDGAAAILRVRDNGIGMSPDLLPRVFDVFVQGQTALDRAEGGLGIGLTVVKRLAELQGGSVEALSDGPGKGSEFVLRIPRALDESGEAKSDLPPAQIPKGRRKLLIVDDNRDSANTLAALLTEMGHDVRIAFDGPTAIAISGEFVPDAVVLDIGLPGMDGYEVAQKLRAVPTHGAVTLIAFTSYG